VIGNIGPRGRATIVRNPSFRVEERYRRNTKGQIRREMANVAGRNGAGGLWGGEETEEEGGEGGGGGEKEEDTRLVNNHGSLSRWLWRPRSVTNVNRKLQLSRNKKSTIISVLGRREHSMPRWKTTPF